MPSDKRQRQRQGRSARQGSVRAQQVADLRRRRVIVIALGVIAFLALVFITTQITGDDDAEVTSTDDTTSTTSAASTTTAANAAAPECPDPGGSAERTISFSGAPEMCIDPNKSYTATFDTTEGEVIVALDTKTTPGTTNNFVFLARYKYYDDTKLFRTDPSIAIIQGGSPHTQSASDPGPGYTITDEGTTNRKYKEGQLIMARTGAPNSAGAQFFLTTGPEVSALDSQGTYVTFGEVTKGLDVLKKIIGLHKADDSGLGGAPSREVKIKTLTIEETL